MQKNEKINDDVLCDKLIENSDKKITALITTIPSRKDVVLRVIDSIYDQVDEIRIVFNGYKDMPDWVFYENLPRWPHGGPKIISYLDPSNQYTDCAKWQYVPENGYVFSIDDDILYPHDYVSRMINKIEQYKRKAVVTVHGSFFQLPFIGFKESKRSFHFILEHPRDTRVPMIGTGTLAFHTDTIKPKFEDFISPSRSDIWFSALCLENNIPMICVERQKEWLKPLRTNNDTIWNKMIVDKEFLDQNSKLIVEHIIPYIEGDIYVSN